MFSTKQNKTKKKSVDDNCFSMTTTKQSWPYIIRSMVYYEKESSRVYENKKKIIIIGLISAVTKKKIN